MEDAKLLKKEYKASCQNCYHEWTIKKFEKKISCSECGENEFIKIGNNNEN
ncbi:MAG: hypothetical protein H8D87_02390 [Deltaproteobacteria bacterium]|nr:hypothetical protein [Candidatus Desulfobacula maris]